MPSNLLTAPQVKNAKPDPSKPDKVRRIPDGKGLWLEVRPTGARYWRYRFKLDGKEQMFNVGPAGYGRGELTLDDARAERARLRELVKRGIHPRAERDSRKAENIEAGRNTFKALALDWMEENKARWADKYLRNIKQTFDLWVYPKLADRPIKGITASDVRAVLKPLKGTSIVGRHCQLWIGGVFRYAITHGAAENDPTYALRGYFVRPEVKHHTALPLKELPDIFTKARADSGEIRLRLALEILAHTFVRPAELMGAAWSEVDFDNALWIVPAERMKMGDTHYVPLSDQAVTLLRQLHRITGSTRWLFPNAWGKDKPMRATNLNRLVDRIGFADRFSPHAFRATASTVLNELGYRSDLIEKQLGHAERDKIRASYNQAQWLEERRKMMQHYSDLITNAASGNVVPLRKEGAAA